MATFIYSLIVITAAYWLTLSANDWRWLMVAIILIWFAETINSEFEFLCDVVSTDYHANVNAAKDIAAGAVLICALAAALLGGLIFWPYITT